MGESAFDERSRDDETLDGACGVASLATPVARIVVDAHARARVDTLREDDDETRTDNEGAFASESTQKRRFELTAEMRAQLPTLLDETQAFDNEPTHKRSPVPEETLSIEVDVQFTAPETPAPVGLVAPTSQRMPATQPVSVRSRAAFAQTVPLATPVPPSHVRPRQPSVAQAPISQAPAANDVVADSGVVPVVRDRTAAATVQSPRQRSGRGLSVLFFLLGAVTAFAVVVAMRYPEARALLHMLISR